MPSLFNEHLEVIILFNASRDSGVVISPFHHGDFTIVVFITEVSEELKVSFINCDLSGLNFWVRLGVKSNSKIRRTNFIISGTKSIPGSLYDFKSSIIKLSSETFEEQIEIDDSIIIGV